MLEAFFKFVRVSLFFIYFRYFFSKNVITLSICQSMLNHFACTILVYMSNHCSIMLLFSHILMLQEVIQVFLWMESNLCLFFKYKMNFKWLTNFKVLNIWQENVISYQFSTAKNCWLLFFILVYSLQIASKKYIDTTWSLDLNYFDPFSQLFLLFFTFIKKSFLFASSQGENFAFY